MSKRITNVVNDEKVEELDTSDLDGCIKLANTASKEILNWKT